MFLSARSPTPNCPCWLLPKASTCRHVASRGQTTRKHGTNIIADEAGFSCSACEMLFGMEISWTRSLGVTAAVISCAYKTVMYVHVRMAVMIRLRDFLFCDSSPEKFLWSLAWGAQTAREELLCGRQMSHTVHLGAASLAVDVIALLG